MVDRGGEKALFAAAVLVRRLERAGLSGRGHEVTAEVLEDLGVTMEQVEGFLRSHSSEVDAALSRGRRDS